MWRGRVEMIREVELIIKRKRVIRAFKRYNYFVKMGMIESADIIINQVGVPVRMLECK